MVKSDSKLYCAKHWLVLVVALLMLVSSLSAGADVIAQLDRNSIVEGETVVLVLQTDDPQQSLDADFSLLEEDFEVLDRRSETQMSIVNGRQAAIIRLLVTLEPKRSGQLVIPPLQLKGAVTRPITLDVAPAPELAPGETPPVFMEVALDPENGPYYVHAQLSLTVRIFYQQNLTEAAINPPSPRLASVSLLDEVPYQAERNGKRYRVLERRYAIFPERSGEMEIPPMQLSGRLIERPADRLWQPSVRGRRVRIESEPLKLTISQRPPEFQGQHWMPARRITLSQQITDAESLHVGEPVTRTVILDAVGLEENMIEEPAWPEMNGVRIYPDQPQGISRDDGHWVLGHKEFRYAVVPERPGELILPEIRLQWWDTVANRERTAVLPEHRVEVLPSKLAQTAIAPTDNALQHTGLLPENGGEAGSATLSRWRLLTALFAALWVLTLVSYLRRGHVRGASRVRKPELPKEESELLAHLKAACSRGDAVGARQHLRRWLRDYGPGFANGSLMEFAARVEHPELAEAIRSFDAALFSPDTNTSWKNKALWREFENWRSGAKRPPRKSDTAELDLYAAGR